MLTSPDYPNFSKAILFCLFLIIGLSASAQYLEMDDTYNVTKLEGDDLYPSWSNDGSKMVYQSDRNGSWAIFQYDLHSGKTTQLTKGVGNEKFPALLNNGKKLIYTVTNNGCDNLYSLDLVKGRRSIVFNRGIASRAAVLPDSEYQLYCLGFDSTAKKWGIYRYEFRYNSLKMITNVENEQAFPKISRDGEMILYNSDYKGRSFSKVNIINWYGEPINVLSGINMSDPSWDQNGFKIIFVSDLDDLNGELYTIWKDGTHLEQLTNDKHEKRTPSISPDGKWLAVSVLLEEGYDIYLIPFTDY